jgi:PKD repeat protein/photosystem II stability/assembly factor-like uncharacterized protein
MKKLSLVLGILIIGFSSIGLNAQWVYTNGPAGSHIPCFASSGSNIFAGTYGSGVFLSTNNGASWTAVNNGLNNNLIEALAISGSNVYAGARGGGVYLSQNNGASWTVINNGLTGTDIWALAVSGTNVFAGIPGSGVFLSTDTGANWTPVNTGLPDLNVWELAVSGTNLFAGTVSGIFLSSDNGASWTAVNNGIPISTIPALAVDGINIYAGTWGHGVYRSTNNGSSWTAVNSGMTTDVVNNLEVNGTNLFAAIKDKGIFLSVNNGTSWTQVNSGLTTQAVKGLGKSGTNMFAGTSEGIFLSTNNGTTWTSANNGLFANTVHLLSFYGSDLFAGTYGGMYISTDDGNSWNHSSLPITSVETFTQFGTSLFAGSWDGLYRSTDNGTNWTLTNVGFNPSALIGFGSSLFAGFWGNGVSRSTDNGTSWTPVNTGLTNTSVTSLAVIGTNIFAGTWGGGVFISTNGGTSWTPVNTGLANNMIWTFAVSGSNLFVGTSGGGVFVSSNNGTSWSAVNSGLSNGNVTVLAVNGTNLFAGTWGSGIFVSSINALTWTQANFSGLSNAVIRSIALTNSEILVGTRGNGVFKRNLSEIIGINNDVPNSGFENWVTSSQPANWLVRYTTASKTTDRFTGNYALKLQTTIQAGNGDGSGTINSLPPNGYEGSQPAFPVSERFKTLDGYYKFSPLNGDSCQFMVMMYKSGYVNPVSPGYGNLVGYGYLCRGSNDIYAPFTVPINYFDNYTIPDSAWISLNAYKDYDFSTMTELEPLGNSTLYVDELNFDNSVINENSQWSIQTSGTANVIFSLYFTNADLGYAVGQNGTILKTVDTGTTWSSLTSGTANVLNSVNFADDNTGYAVGVSGTILKTTDGGANWTAQISGTTNNLYSVSFIDANTGFTVGQNGIILKTTNGGTNWTSQTSGTTTFLRSVCYTDLSTAYIAGHNGTILKTSDGGTTWTQQFSGTIVNLLASYFQNSSTGCAVGIGGTILLTHDGGNTWEAPVIAPFDLLSVCFPDSNTGYAVGANGAILKTTDGGANWFSQASGTGYALRSVIFTDTKTGYAAGLNGTILKTTTGGVDENLTYSNASLNGPWFFHQKPLTPYNDNLSYLVFDGNGNILDMSGFGWPIGGTYSVSSDGIFSGNLIMDEETYPLIGQLTSPDAGTCKAAGMNWIISRISDPGALADSLIGTLYTENCGQSDVSFKLNSQGEIISATGLTPPVTGRIYADMGVYLGHIRTGDINGNGWNELSIMGYYTDKLLNGTVSLEMQGSCGNTASQLARAGAPKDNNFGFELWNDKGTYLEPQGFATTNQFATGPYYPVTRSTDHYPESVGQYSLRIESKASLLPETEALGIVLQNSENSLENSGPGPAFPIVGHPTSLTGYYKYVPQNGDTMRIQIALYLKGEYVSYNALLSTVAKLSWTPFTIPLPEYSKADSGSIMLASYNSNGPPSEYAPYGNSVLYIDNLNFDYLVTDKFNFGFEEWTDKGDYLEPQSFATTNIFSPGTFYPVTRSDDHYPLSVGNYSIRLESKPSLIDSTYAYGVVLQNSSNIIYNGPGPSFPITGHPTSLTGYYKYFPQNGDTMHIEIGLYKNGEGISNNVFLSTSAATNWTSFNIPLPAYISADSGTILFATYNCNGPTEEYRPYGNSVLFLDNLNFDVLITGENCQSDFDFVISSVTGEAGFTSRAQNAAVYYWDFGDGAYSTQINPVHTYTKAGAYNVCLTVMNSKNDCQSVICKNLIYIPSGEFYVQADFSFVPGATDNSIVFSDLSTPNTTDWYWTMGDGKVMKTQNPEHIFAKPGIYSVCLIAIDKVNGLSNSVCKDVSVGEIACAVKSDFTCFIDPDALNVSFSNKVEGEVSDFFWTFGDGNTSTLANPTHTYSGPGFYTVRLAARNNSNTCMDVSVQFIQVGNTDCRSSFSYEIDPADNSVKFTDESKGMIDYYYWEFGDGTFSVLQNPEKTYKKPGIFIVGETVIDNTSGCIDFSYQPVQSGEVDCSADFISYIDSSSHTGYFTNRVMGESTALLWSFGDGRFSTQDNPVHVFPGQGIYSTGLNTYDFNSGCMDYYQEMLIIGGLGIDCEADFAYILDPSDPEVIFNNRSVGDIVGSVWNFGDGSENSQESDPVHTYLKGGYYNVCLSVINSSGIRNMSCKWVLVSGSALNDCRADFIFNIDSANLKVNFVDKSFGEVNKYTWDFGDSKSDSISTSQNPVHSYNEKGYYLVQLTAENTTTGCISEEYKLLNVADLQVLKASFSYKALDPDKKLSGYPVDLVAASSGDGATVEWDFGDKQLKKGSFTVMDSTGRYVTHYYEKPGKYTVCVRISDPVGGQTDTYCSSVFTKWGVGLNNLVIDSPELNIYPNPFIDNTVIDYTVPQSQYVEIAVFDQLGRKIETLVKAGKDKGSYIIDWKTKNLATGVYYLRMTTSELVITKQFVITK